MVTNNLTGRVPIQFFAGSKTLFGEILGPTAVNLLGWEPSKANCINRIFSILWGGRMGIEPTSEIWVHAATSRARLYRNGRTKVAASVHCRPPQPSILAAEGRPFLATFCFVRSLQASPPG